MPEKKNTVGEAPSRTTQAPLEAEVDTKRVAPFQTTLPAFDRTPSDIPTVNIDAENPTVSFQVLDSSSEPARKSHSSFSGLLGRFHYVRTLGEGAFGIVVQVWDPELQTYRAVKIPHRHLIDSGQVDPEAYVREARKIAQLGKHAGIVEVFDVQRLEDGTPFMISEFIPGGSLSSRIKAGRMDWRPAVELVVQIADAIGHAHSKGVVHRDLKPANILMTEEGKPVVADFGLALQDEEFSYKTTVCGTYQYMSPQQIRGEANRVDGRSDIYSLGVILYELLAGRLPYKSREVNSLKREILNDEPTPIRQYNPAVPPQLEAICRQAMAKGPADRFSTAADFSAALRGVLDNPLAAEEEKQSPSSRGSGSWLPYVFAAAVLALIAVLALNRSQHGAVSDSTPIAAPTAELPAPDLEIQVQKATESATYRSLRNAALPLQVGDKLQIHVAVSRPMYAYIYWIDYHGKVVRYWPLPDADLSKQQTISELDSPAKSSAGADAQWWQIVDAGGPEVILVGVSDTPLNDAQLGEFEVGVGPFAESLRKDFKEKGCKLADAGYPKKEFKTESADDGVNRVRGAGNVLNPVVSLKTVATDDSTLRHLFKGYYGWIVETKE